MFFLMELLYKKNMEFGFGNREECIILFVFIREICQRKKFNDQFTFLVFS